MGRKKAKITIKPDIRKKVSSFKKILNARGIPVEQIVVFGSQVKRQTHAFSDIDVCVISSVFGKDLIEEAVMLRQIADEIDDRIEPHPYSKKDFMIKEDPFASEIRRTGLFI